MTGSQIKTVRQQLGLTQEQFARELDVTVSTVNRWENNHANPSHLADKIIKNLCVTRNIPLPTV